jgi:SagB-type dehydrogenase family enzyme
MRTAPVPLALSTVDSAGVDAGERLHTHLRSLRDDPLSANPAGWQVDWAAGPWPVKVYTGAVRTPLDRDTGVGRLLFYSFAVSRVRFDPRGGLPPTPDAPVRVHQGTPLVTRRPIPSGGAMYPTEAYLVSGGRVRHYDPYRHELVDLRRAAAPVAAALPARLAGSRLLVLTDRFAKNVHKYGEFAYRLGAVDVGVAVGRVLRLARAGFDGVEVLTGFDDAALHAALGLAGAEEAPYAVVTLGADAPLVSTAGLPDLDPPSTVQRTTRTVQPVMLAAVHEAAATRCPAPGTRPRPPGAADGRRTALAPALPVDLTDPETLLRRSSNGARFTGEPMTAGQLSTVLRAAALASAGLRSAGGDLDDADITLRCAVHRVGGTRPGWYAYLPARHELVLLTESDASAADLQDALFSASLNIELAACTVHVAGWLDHRSRGAGVRGYREQQLAVGVAVEALTTAAEAAGAGSHPVLGFDARAVDDRYGLLDGRGALAQVSIGLVRPDPSWEVTVLPR